MKQRKPWVEEKAELEKKYGVPVDDNGNPVYPGRIVDLPLELEEIENEPVQEQVKKEKKENVLKRVTKLAKGKKHGK